MSQKIRLATEFDAAQIAEIYRPYVENTAISFEEEPPQEEEMGLRINKIMLRHAWLVYEIEGKIVGYAYSGPFRERKAYQWIAEVSVYVHEDYQGRAIGPKLYEALHRICKLQGYAKCYAGMTVPNEKSRSFHLKMGYMPLAYFEDIGYKFNQWHGTEWFSKDLQPSGSAPKKIIPIQQLERDKVNKILS